MHYHTLNCYRIRNKHGLLTVENQVQSETNQLGSVVDDSCNCKCILSECVGYCALLTLKLICQFFERSMVQIIVGVIIYLI
jgi:hypothetical protein